MIQAMQGVTDSTVHDSMVRPTLTGLDCFPPYRALDRWSVDEAVKPRDPVSMASFASPVLFTTGNQRPFHPLFALTGLKMGIGLDRIALDSKQRASLGTPIA